MIHRHLLTLLHQSLGVYLDLANEEKAISVLDSTSIGEDSLKRTLAILRDTPPRLQVHGDAGSTNLPLVVSQQLSRRITQRPLGHTSSGEESVISQQSAKIEVFAKTNEEVEILTDLVSRSLQQGRVDFIRNGYLYFSIEGLDELSPHEQLTAEELGVFVRRISVSAMLQEDVARLYSEPTLGTLTIGLVPHGRIDYF